jgi:hypothetical protein
MRSDVRPPSRSALRWCLALAGALAFGAAGASAQTLAARAKESGCIDAPRVVDGTTNLYRCSTSSGAAAIFNVPEGTAPERAPRRAGNASGAVAGSASASVPAPPVAGLPRVDPATQKGRDDLRRRVLQDELSAEEKLLGEARTSYANGAPAPLPEERTDPRRYAERIARLREAVLRHERNIEMLRKELGVLR